MDNLEILATLGTQDTGRRKAEHKNTTQFGDFNYQSKPIFHCFSLFHELNIRENRRGNQEWTIQRHWQYWVHKTRDEDKRNTKTQSFFTESSFVSKI